MEHAKIKCFNSHKEKKINKDSWNNAKFANRSLGIKMRFDFWLTFYKEGFFSLAEEKYE